MGKVGSKNKTKKEKTEEEKQAASIKYAAQKKEVSNRSSFKKEFQYKWDTCKTSAERAQVKKEFYSYKGKYTETFLDNTWTLITAKFRREKLPELYKYLEICSKY